MSLAMNSSQIIAPADLAADPTAFFEELQKSGKPILVGLGNGPAAVILDLAAYQQILDRLDRAETTLSLQAAMEAFDRGEGLDARDALEDLRIRRGIPRSA